MFAVPSRAAGGRWQTAVCDREAWWVESRRAACEREEGQLRWRGLLGNVLPAPPFANAADGAPAQRVDFGLSAPLAVLQAASRRTMKEALRLQMELGPPLASTLDFHSGLANKNVVPH
uniref:uncharacterized protein LOC107000840 isoform X2 n=1 Tax=Macaca mulatta TaxID=9544 RepID=UPI0010A224DC|nr:uncharacterized protein LOC107000840 isoform X2 [Macaca mulatta]